MAKWDGVVIEIGKNEQEESKSISQLHPDQYRHWTVSKTDPNFTILVYEDVKINTFIAIYIYFATLLFRVNPST